MLGFENIDPNFKSSILKRPSRSIAVIKNEIFFFFLIPIIQTFKLLEFSLIYNHLDNSVKVPHELFIYYFIILKIKKYRPNNQSI